jgi:hypothetical protein
MAIDPKEFDWTGLAEKIDAHRGGGAEVGRKAIAEVLGEPFLKAAVDFYIGYPAAFMVAQSILDLLRPEASRRHCLEIYTTETESWRRQGAVELLTTLGDRSILPWIATFLRDDDQAIQGLGAAVLEQLVWGERVEFGMAEQYIVLAEQHENSNVRVTAARIREHVRMRAG